MTTSKTLLMFIALLMLIGIISLEKLCIVGVNSSLEADRISSLPNQPKVGFKQYSGYVKVGETSLSRSFFYYFVEAEVDPASKPVVLWLSGGPGCSSVGQGAFSEHGPFRPTTKGLVKNPFSWNKVANMIYLDTPIGVGFSYSANKSDYAFVNDQITARDNLLFLQGWFSRFPMYQNNDFFITGESYAGHFAPQLAELILQTKTNIRLKGIAMGNPLLEFDTDFSSGAEFLWSHGQISDSTYEMLKNVCTFAQIKREIRAGTLTQGCLETNRLLSIEVSGYTDRFDVTADTCQPQQSQQAYVLTKLQAEEKIDVCVEDKTITYLNRKEVQKALHTDIKLVGVSRWSTCSSVTAYDFQNLENPTISLLGKLVKSGVRVLAYSGDQDSVIPLTGTRSLVAGLAKELGLNTTESHRAWFKGRQVAGWTHVYGDMLTFATIRGAGHEAPSSQPGRSLVLFKAFLEGKQLPKH